MKKLYILLFLILNVVLRAQLPQKIGYQAVVRDERGDLVTNRNMGVRITILQNGMEVYQETHTPQTNANGLFSIEIGNGAVLHGVFGAIEWSEGECSVKTDIDLMSGTSYTLTSTTEALSIPYAMHAQTAQRLVENPQESDPIFVASVAKNITDTNVQYWNKKLDSADLEVLKIEVQTKVDSAYVNAKLQNLETGVDTALLNALLAKIEMLEKTVEDLQIANGTLVKDIDGNAYKTVKIGTQTWMAENLRVTRFNNGDSLMYIREDSAWNSYRNTMPPAYCYYDNDLKLREIYGNLYNWYVVGNTSDNTQNAGRKICPTGWHIPSENEWIIMRDYLIANGYNYNGLPTVPGYINGIGKSLAKMSELWKSSSSFPVGAIGHPDYAEKMNMSGFSALPGGFRQFNGIFTNSSWDNNNRAFFMTSNVVSNYTIRYTFVEAGSPAFVVCDQNPFSAVSIRCLKD